MIGRAGEVAEVADLIANARVVTVTGSGGIGKTRLALAVAAERLPCHPGGTFWVELAALSSPESVSRAVRVAFEIIEVPGVTIERQLAIELGGRPTLIVLDNCEHLLERCAEFVAAIVTANPAVAVLATSREPLGVPGEITWRVPSLAFPTLETTGPGVEMTCDPQTLSSYPAVELFIDRARRVRPTFEATAADMMGIAQICCRLDGIPLAIELAAARCRELSTERIASELGDRFRFLTGGSRTALPRQQTLAASVDWSYDSLNDPERVTFRRLGAFAGPFPLEAAEAIVEACGGLDHAEILGLLCHLIDKNLVVAEIAAAGDSRYRLLETMRAYALLLADDAGELDAIRDAHLSWWSQWLEPRAAMPSNKDVSEVTEYYDQLRTAMEWAVKDASAGLRLLGLLSRPWTTLGKAADILSAADALLTDANAERYPAAWLRAANETAELHLAGRGTGAFLTLLARVETVAARVGADYEWSLARSMHSTELSDKIAARALAHDHGDLYSEAMATIMLANHFGETDPIAAGSYLRSAESIALNSPNRYVRHLALEVQVTAARASGDLAKCIDLGRTVLAERGAMPSAGVLTEMSVAALFARDSEALRTIVDAADRAERIAPGLARWGNNARHRLHLIDQTESRVPWSPHSHSEDWRPSTATLWLAGREGIDSGDPEAAIELTRNYTLHNPHSQAVLAAVEAAATTSEDLWNDALASAADHGLRLIAVDALEGLACTAAQVESWSECVRLAAAAQFLREETGYCWRFGFEQRAIDAAHDAAIDALGHEAEICTAQGRQLGWRDAAAYAQRSRGKRKRPRHGWASLTPTERQVVELIAEGMTNPKIAERLLMGRSTVKTHLDHVFVKLGMNTRAQVAAQVGRETTTDTRDH